MFVKLKRYLLYRFNLFYIGTLIIGLILRLAIFNFDFATDVHNHLVWSKDMIAKGIVDFYALPSSERYASVYPNYAPFVIFMFSFSRLIFWPLYQAIMFVNTYVPFFPSSSMSFFESKFFLIFLLKLPAILADLLIAIILGKYFVSKVSHFQKKLLLASTIFSPALILTSTLWGQTDSVLILLFLITLIFLERRHLFWGVLSIFVCMFFKPNVVLFLPVLGNFLWSQYSPKKVVTYHLFFLIVFSIFSAYLFTGQISLLSGIDLYLQNALISRDLTQISNSAFNFWVFLLGYGASSSAFGQAFLGKTYEMWGILLWLFIVLVVWWREQKHLGESKVFYYLLTICAFAGYLFLSKMHERYILYPLLLLSVLTLQDWKYWKSLIMLQIFAFITIYFAWSTPFLPLLGLKAYLNHEFGSRLISFWAIVIFGVLWFQRPKVLPKSNENH